MDDDRRYKAFAALVTIAAAMGLAHVPVPMHGRPWVAAVPPSDASVPSATIDPNLATLDELQRLPGIGPTLARRIIDARGGTRFCRIEDLARVRGIGPHTIERMRDRLAIPPCGMRDR